MAQPIARRRKEPMIRLRALLIASLIVALFAFLIPLIGDIHAFNTFALIGLVVSLVWCLWLVVGLRIYGGSGAWLFAGAPLALIWPVIWLADLVLK
jgi:hypothetical protein